MQFVQINKKGELVVPKSQKRSDCFENFVNSSGSFAYQIL